MTEYIEREAAIKKVIYESDPFGVHQCFGWRARDIEAALRAIPADDVAPVVRCKDCLYWERDTGFCHYHSRYYDGGASWDIFFNEDDFCSYGERNEND